MKFLLPLLGGLLLLAGCSTHSHGLHNGVVTLYLDVPAGRQVSLACSRDGFVPHPARREHGRWAVSLPADGPFRYFYLVDGAVYVPPCRLREKDDFGADNCVFDPGL
ncbi:hypothetical protein JWG42_14895 [Desulfoprunum benzoelyticum]|uniref:Glycoside hydrolase family 13 N-terminal domain-containing protein n=1 Tax=Desulfoprunum benzoelyticum TaxID=1506996 RepID=A0A840V2B7_9BACT|nr:hypothetical protein [Desulfoprunum benzoelyticum]MBB5347291.1 hypothetical protein [Desulfoprunum benzoelyticum]MBM9531445.1 hypothetical protein [Desulfoprunum benzoelyticum]